MDEQFIRTMHSEKAQRTLCALLAVRLNNMFLRPTVRAHYILSKKLGNCYILTRTLHHPVYSVLTV